MRPSQPAHWLRSGWPGWVMLAAGVGLWDALAPETMSNAWRRAHDHPASLVATIAAWSYLTAHLFNILPERFDPLEYADDIWTALTGVRHGSTASAPAELAQRDGLLRRPVGG